jgi:hypothetical protein
MKRSAFFLLFLLLEKKMVATGFNGLRNSQ